MRWDVNRDACCYLPWRAGLVVWTCCIHSYSEQKMISSDCPSENANGSPVARISSRKFATPGPEECSPMFDVSTSSSTADLSLSRNDLTPRRKLSLCSATSSPGMLTASGRRHQTPPDSHGIRFRALNFSTEESSPYLQYRTGLCLTKDHDSQQKNESSPSKRTRSKRWREQLSLNRSEEGKAVKDERIGAVVDCLSSLRQQIPGCSPLLPSPAEDARRDAIPEAALHFDRTLVRTGLTASVGQGFPENLPEEPTSFSAESHFALSSTPVHSQTSQTFTPFIIPFRLSDASPGVIGSASNRLLFTPERCAPSKNPPSRSEVSRDDPAFEHARRNLFQTYLPKVSGDTNSRFTDLVSGSPPSSGYVSNSSSGSLLNSSGSSGGVPYSVAEKMDYAEVEEKCEGGKAYIDEGVPVESLMLADHEIQMNHESGEPVDSECQWTEESLLQGLCSSGEQASLIGDFSRPYTLPLVRSRNQDLKAISSDTMADIVAGCFDNVIDFCQVIDCRYPYEFIGGHIRGAKNIYEEEDLLRKFFGGSTLRSRFEPSKRSILIFHCEFSSERAPKLLRLLRKNDRDINTYPSLCYPEAYVLEGGYRAFFESHPLLCEPSSYVPMLENDFCDDLKKFRAKSRSYQDECGKRILKKICATTNY